MRGAAASTVWLALLIASVAVPSAATAKVHPPPDSVVAPEHPPVQGSGGGTPDLPCGIPGPAVDLGDGSRYVNSRGTLRAAMIFVDFSDAPASAYPWVTPQDRFDQLVPDAEATLRRLSYGKLRLSVTPELRWIRMPHPLSSYGLEASDPQSSGPVKRYIRDALHAADGTFDFSKFRAVYVMAGPGAERRGGATNYAPGTGVKVDGTRPAHVLTLNSYGDSINSTVLAHELGHAMGLPDLYDVYTTVRWDRFVGDWDVMSNVWMNTGMLSWTRRLVGWLGDPAFRCVRDEQTVTLSPVTARGGLKAAVVRTGDRRAWVVEARDGTDGPNCRDSGVLIYRVDADVETGRGPIRVVDAQRGDGSCGPHTTALFKPAGTGVPHFENGRIEVTVLERAGSGFRVRVRARRR